MHANPRILTSADIEAMPYRDEILTDGDEATALRTAARAQGLRWPDDYEAIHADVEHARGWLEDEERDADRGRLWEQEQVYQRHSVEFAAGVTVFCVCCLVVIGYCVWELVRHP